MWFMCTALHHLVPPCATLSHLLPLCTSLPPFRVVTYCKLISEDLLICTQGNSQKLYRGQFVTRNVLRQAVWKFCSRDTKLTPLLPKTTNLICKHHSWRFPKYRLKRFDGNIVNKVHRIILKCILLVILYTGLLKIIVRVLTTCHRQYTWDRSM